MEVMDYFLIPLKTVEFDLLGTACKYIDTTWIELDLAKEQ